MHRMSVLLLTKPTSDDAETRSEGDLLEGGFVAVGPNGLAVAITCGDQGQLVDGHALGDVEEGHEAGGEAGHLEHLSIQEGELRRSYRPPLLETPRARKRTIWETSSCFLDW